jgi:hypothetical protein
MAGFLDRLQNWDWGEFNKVLEEISKDRKRAYDFSQPPGAWVNEALKQAGLANSAFMGVLREQLGDDYAGFPRPEERQVIYDVLWALYGPKSTAQVGDETTAKTLLARSWLSQALGLPISTTAAVPIARTPTAAGEVIQRALSLEGPANSLTLQLLGYYQGKPQVVDDQAASFLVMAHRCCCCGGLWPGYSPALPILRLRCFQRVYAAPGRGEARLLDQLHRVLPVLGGLLAQLGLPGPGYEFGPPSHQPPRAGRWSRTESSGS